MSNVIKNRLDAIHSVLKNGGEPGIAASSGDVVCSDGSIGRRQLLGQRTVANCLAGRSPNAAGNTRSGSRSFTCSDPVRDVAIWDWSNKSEVFGNQIPSADPDGDGVAFELALRFPGQQATDASGLFYNYQRNTSLQWGCIRRVIALDYFGGLQALRMLVGILFHSPILWDCAKTIMVLMRPFIKRHMARTSSHACLTFSLRHG
ncbi:TPA: hypothetical protein ACKP7S_001448 [Stenotrophomonas maltophilia]|nr:hypothetical protein [Stenotrophomonas maltophilia]